MGDEDDGRPGLLPDPKELEVEPLPGHLVERAERLVHQEDRGLERERARDGDPLLHASRQLPGIPALEAGELDERQHLPRSRRPRSFGDRAHLERELYVPLDSAPIEENRGLEDHPVVAVQPRAMR